ncbi:2-succinyl-6-hydroxy-2,4-cyclohexadiene-1-carboxylate synthase [Aeromonas diversa]|uniref:2-succinyl-6-hydroxy-2, 4-cyclohexadiene-1-carboxylate synthase n=1 Tax=Aeromonas diversa TaxID=502790 RepID=UPI0039A3B710
MAEATTVLLHGLLGHGGDWSGVTAALPGPVLTLDLPGHGTNRALRVASFAEFDDWLRQRLQAARIERYRLVGYSLGGRLALYHASREPAGLEALWLENCHPGLPEEMRAVRRAHDECWAQRFERESLPTVLDDWYRQGVFADLDETARSAQIARRLDNDGPAVAAMLRATSLGLQPDLCPWLLGTALPVTYLSGRRDHKFHTLACQLAGPGSTIDHRTLEGGHNLHATLPESYARELTRWASPPEEKSHD